MIVSGVAGNHTPNCVASSLTSKGAGYALGLGYDYPSAETPFSFRT
jgi:hypothetical protein